MNTRTVSLVFGFTVVAAGVLGFIPNPLVAHDGIIAVNAVHNLVHILTGSVFLIVVYRYPGYSGKIIKLVGVTYVAVTILGLLTSGNMLLGIVHVNNVDH